MATRSIPPLPETSKAGDSRLLQVTAVVRHGARTPWNTPERNTTCWPEYAPVWDCNLTTWLGTPTTTAQEQFMFVMDKQYTALHDASHKNLTNYWRGTCQQGQLLQQGYDQELQNGQFLRDAYVYQGDEDYSHDARLRLLNAQTLDMNALDSQLYYRSDDEQRTLMSGQVVLRGLLQPELEHWVRSGHVPPVLPLHVADYGRDIMVANPGQCPRLAEMEERFHKSQAYQTFVQSPERQLLQAFQQQVLDGGTADLDCLMTTLCTDRPLPDAVNDYQGEAIGLVPPAAPGGYNKSSTATATPSAEGDQATVSPPLPPQHDTDNYGPHLFARLAQLDAYGFNLLAIANQGEYSKVAMWPLWQELLHHIRAATTETTSGNPPTPAKFALFSGHDTTLIPLLASLGVWTLADFWPPYASLVVFEVHEVNFDGTTDLTLFQSNYAFRLLYNGQVWTPRIPHCPPAPEHLCDLNVLLQAAGAGTADWQCDLEHPQPQTYRDPVSQAQDFVKTSGGQWAFGVVALASFVMGMLCTVTCVCCCCPNNSAATTLKRRRGRRRLVSTTDDDGESDGIMLSERPTTSYRDNVPEENDNSDDANGGVDAVEDDEEANGTMA